MARQKRKRAARTPKSRLLPKLRAAVEVVEEALDKLVRRPPQAPHRRG